MANLNQTAAPRTGFRRHGLARAAERANRRRAWPRWTVPALRASLYGGVVAGLLGAGFWAWQSGLAQGVRNGFAGVLIHVTALVGFQVQEVFIEGRSGSEKADLLAAIKLKRGDPILGLRLTEARAELERLPWIAAATIERRLPDLVFIKITERRPMALWQFDRKLVLIDKAGNILADQGPGVDRFAYLPIIVGQGAPAHAPELLALLAGEPAIMPRVGALVWVGGRRWDMRLDNGINVRLPENDSATALHRLSEIVTRESLFDRDISAIDLRLPDRMIVQTGESAVPHKRLPGEKI